MTLTDLKMPHVLIGLSLVLFVVSLAMPVGDGLIGWQVFLLVFWVLPESFLSDPGIFFYALSGAAANVFLFSGWAANFFTRLRKVAPWIAGCAVLLASVNLFRGPWTGLGLGYWLWLSSSAVALAAARQLGKFAKRESQPVLAGVPAER